MYATKVRDLKKNPSLALRQAREAPVLILKGNEPDAVLLHLDTSLLDTTRSLRPALAATLYRDGTLSLGAAARLSGLALTDFIQHLDDLGIEIVQVDASLDQETQDITPWLASS